MEAHFKPSYRANSIYSESLFEFDESEVWNSNQVVSPEFKKSICNSRSWKMKRIENCDLGCQNTKSSPVNILDWSKILREDCNRRRENDEDDYDDNDEEEESKIPPHEFLARQFARNRIVPFSVHEGVGRTLKGRDLYRVRAAIWEKIGFED